VPATLIAGFSFTALVEIETLDPATASEEALGSEPIFYIATTASLSLSLLVTAISSMGVIFGQRVMVQASAEQGSKHEEVAAELNQKVVIVLLALGASMFAVVIAAVAVVWVKQVANTEETSTHRTSWSCSVTVITVFCLLIAIAGHMFWRLFTCKAASSRLALNSSKARYSQAGLAHAGPVSGVRVEEFYVNQDVRPPGSKSAAAASASRPSASTESSSLLSQASNGSPGSCFNRP